MKADIEKASLIIGWMDREDLEWLWYQGESYSLIAEVGSYLGRSTRAIADGGVRRIIAIDDWTGINDSALTECDRKYISRSQFEQNMLDVIQEGRLEIWQCSHRDEEELERKLAGRVLDMVFIDGDHAYSSVRADIVFWEAKVRQGGLVSGHDMHNADVARAVTEVLGSVTRVEGGHIWYKRKE